MDKPIYILGIDGGGTSTKGCLFNSKGQTLVEMSTKGTNLYVYKNIAIKRLINLINNISERANLNLSEIAVFGFGLSGVSDINQRELLLKELDKLNISSNSLILSDAEIAFNLLCPAGFGVLVSVGTGVICISKNSKGKVFRVAGKGLEKDIGSGYWIGKQAIDRLVINPGLIDEDYELKELHEIIKQIYGINHIYDLANAVEGFEVFSKIASLAREIINVAQGGNDIALSIVQEGTRNVGEYLIDLLERTNYTKDKLIVGGNGSVLKNTFYRKLLNQSLEFELKKIHWVLSDISPAYSAGIMAAASKNINISIENIVEYIKN